MLGTPVLNVKSASSETLQKTVVLTEVPENSTVVVIASARAGETAISAEDNSGLGLYWPRILFRTSATSTIAFFWTLAPDGIPAGTTLTVTFSPSTAGEKILHVCHFTGRGLLEKIVDVQIGTMNWGLNFNTPSVGDDTVVVGGWSHSTPGVTNSLINAEATPSDGWVELDETSTTGIFGRDQIPVGTITRPDGLFSEAPGTAQMAAVSFAEYELVVASVVWPQFVFEGEHTPKTIGQIWPRPKV